MKCHLIHCCEHTGLGFAVRADVKQLGGSGEHGHEAGWTVGRFKGWI